MRLVSVAAEGFRGWVSPEVVNLDASVVIVNGPNGTGKTSLLDAILWVLSGEIARFGKNRHDVVSLFAGNGLARVELKLRDAQGAEVNVVRSSDGNVTRLRVDISGDVSEGEQAQAALVRRLWPAGSTDSTGDGGLGSALGRSVYLQQDEIRQFVEADTDADRFSAISELVGTGRVSDLQITLENQQKQWARQTNEDRETLSAVANRKRGLESALGAIPQRTPAPATSSWTGWAERANRFLQRQALAAEPGPTASDDIDIAIKSIQASLQGRDRKIQAFERARDQLRQADLIAKEAGNLQSLTEQLGTHDQAIHDQRAKVESLEIAAADERRALLEARERSADEQALATLALRQLGARCPVCDQEYDREATERRLAAKANVGVAEVALKAAQQLPATSNELRRLEAEGAALRRHHNELSARQQEARGLVESASAELTAAGQKDFSIDAIESAIELARKEAAEIREILSEGEKLSLEVARAAEAPRRSELERQIAALEMDQRNRESLVRRRDRASVTAKSVLDSLRSASDELVSRRLEAVGPVLDRIYARIDPHPAFRAVNLGARFSHGRGRVWTKVSDPERHLVSDLPAIHLSSSQINAVAISIFLA
jgi:exonuclease SbcC